MICKDIHNTAIFSNIEAVQYDYNSSKALVIYLKHNKIVIEYANEQLAKTDYERIMSYKNNGNVKKNVSYFLER